jgi:hypothetical protein
MCLQVTFIRFTPSIILPHSPSSLRTISTDFSIVFSYTYTNYTNHIHPPSPSLFKHCSTHPWMRPVFPSHPPFFFSVYIDYSKGVLPWYFTHVYIVLQSDSPPPLLSLYTDAICFNIIQSLSFLFSFHLCTVPSERLLLQS